VRITRAMCGCGDIRLIAVPFFVRTERRQAYLKSVQNICALPFEKAAGLLLVFGCFAIQH
jgi:hypothetical protein